MSAKFKVWDVVKALVGSETETGFSIDWQDAIVVAVSEPLGGGPVNYKVVVEAGVGLTRYARVADHQIRAAG